MVGFASRNGDRVVYPFHVVPWGRRATGEYISWLQGLVSSPDEEACNHVK